MTEENKKPIDPQFFVVVRSIVQNSNREILLLKRHATASHNASQWEIPGGKLEHGEAIDFAIQREIYEETKLVIKPLNKSYYCISRPSKNDSPYHTHTYVEIATDSIVIAGNINIETKHVDYVWERLENIFDYDLTAETRNILSCFHIDVDRLIKLDEPEYGTAIPVVRAMVKKENKYLFIKRASGSSYADTWELPGGKVNLLEGIIFAAVREVFEEVGLVVDINPDPLYINSLIQNVGIKKGYTYINITYEGEIKSGKIRLTDKHSEYKWLGKKEIANLKLAPYMEIPINEILFSKS